jgi:hypothetical protein
MNKLCKVSTVLTVILLSLTGTVVQSKEIYKPNWMERSGYDGGPANPAPKLRKLSCKGWSGTKHSTQDVTKLYEVTVNRPWISVSSMSGSYKCAAGVKSVPVKLVVSINQSANQLPVGTHHGSFKIKIKRAHENGYTEEGSTYEHQVSINVQENFKISTNKIDFGAVDSGKSGVVTTSLPISVTNISTGDNAQCRDVTFRRPKTADPKSPFTGNFPETENICPGQTVNYNITFTPEKLGTYDGDFGVLVAPNNRERTIAVYGERDTE